MCTELSAHVPIDLYTDFLRNVVRARSSHSDGAPRAGEEPREAGAGADRGA